MEMPVLTGKPLPKGYVRKWLFWLIFGEIPFTTMRMCDDVDY